MKNILIGGAWPYANGSLHIGHIAALLPGDVLARYYRAKGENVYYVSGSDCHGTPITIRAKEEYRSPRVISDHYHKEFRDVFAKLGFSFDLYTKTSDKHHIDFATKFHKRIYAGEYVEERVVKQAYCPACQKVLTDRLIIGICPSCGEKTRGDQCEACGEVHDINSVIDAKCSLCHVPLSFNETPQLFLCISKLEKELKELLLSHPNWRKNAIAFTKRYMNEGLRDRAITRDLDWGIDVPHAGYENKKMYIWAENVLGYLSAAARLCEERGTSLEEVFGENARHYYIHGKDNIPFHTIILPALLLAHGGYRLPDDIISSEYLTLEGRKISTSNNRAVWAKDLAQEYDPDTIRYFLIANGPEKRDTDFSWREFTERNNSELVGAWGNFVNRTLAFIPKYLDNRLSPAAIDEKIQEKAASAFALTGTRIEEGHFKDALEGIFELVRFGNKYYDAHEPWKTRSSDHDKCQETLYNCTYLIANIAILLKPFLPFSSAKLIGWLDLEDTWQVQSVNITAIPEDFGVLFARIKPNACKDTDL